MRHGVDDDVNAERIGSLFGEFAKIPGVLAFSLPAITEVRVMTDKNHHVALVIIDSAVIRPLGVRSLRTETVQSRVDTGYLWLFIQIINTVKDFMLKRHFFGLTVWKDALDLGVKNLPLVFSPKIVNH